MSFDSSANLLFTIGTDATDAQGNMQRFRSLMGKDLAAMKAEFADWSKSVFGDLSTVSGAMKAGAAAAAALAVGVVAGLSAAAEKTARYAEEIEDGMDKTGLSAEQMSKLRYAAEATGLGYDKLIQSLVIFESNVVKAARGEEQALRGFKALGISQEEVKAGTEDLLGLLMREMDAYKGLVSVTEKAGIAREQFGRGGADMLEWLSMGSAAMKEFGDRAQQLGRVLKEEDVVAAKAFGLANKELKAEMEGLAYTVGNSWMPVMQKWAAFKIAMAETLKKDTGGPLAELKAWAGFADEYGKAQERLTAALKAAVGEVGSKKLAPPAGGDDDGVKKTLRDYAELSRLMEGLQIRTAGLESDEARVTAEAARYKRELEDARAELEKLLAEYGVSADVAARETKALADLPAAIDKWAAAELARIRERQAREKAEADERAERERHQAAEKDARERQEEDERRARQTEAYQRELEDLQGFLAAMSQQRMTARERVEFQYEMDLQRFSEVEEAKALKTAEGIGEREALEQQFAMNRQALLNRYSGDLAALANSTGWNAVFGEEFARSLRGNEELLREWAESSNQALMMVAVAGETLADGSRRWFGQFAQGMGQNIAQAVVYEKSVGAAMAAALKSTLATISGESAVWAIYAAGLGFLRLAQHDYPAAAEAFKAAAIFGTVSAAAAVAGRAIPGGQGGQDKAGAVGQGPGSGASGGSPAGPRAEEERGLRVAVYVQGHLVGWNHIDELTDAISDAVENRDVRLISTRSRTGGQATR